MEPCAECAGAYSGDLTVWREGDALDLMIAADQYDKLLAHLDQFIIMDDVELVAPDPTAETTIGLTGPQAREVLARMGLPVPTEPMSRQHVEWNGLNLKIYHTYGTSADHFEISTHLAGLTLLWRALSTAGATPVGSAALDAFRVAECFQRCRTHRGRAGSRQGRPSSVNPARGVPISKWSANVP